MPTLTPAVTQGFSLRCSDVDVVCSDADLVCSDSGLAAAADTTGTAMFIVTGDLRCSDTRLSTDLLRCADKPKTLSPA